MRIEQLLEENRGRIYQLDEHLILDVLRGFSGYPTIEIPVLDEVPKDAFLYRIWQDARYGCMACIVLHESFDPVPKGTMLPIHAGKMRTIQLEVK